MSKQIEQTTYQGEITLKELIQILLDQKWLIVGITAITLILAGIYSFVIVEPSYESKAVLNASPIGSESVINNNIESIVNDTGLYPVSTVETYMEQLKSPQLLTRVISGLNLQDSSGNRLNINALQSMINISNVENTNLLELRVTGKNPDKVKIIANELAKDFIDYIDESGQNQSQITAGKIEAQLVLEESNLAEKSQELAQFVVDSVSIDELKSEIGSLISQITSIKELLNNLEVAIVAAEDKLAMLAPPQLSDTGYVIDSLQLGSNGKLIGESIELVDANDSELASSLITIEYINVQNGYITNTSTYDANKDQLKILEEELIAKQALLVEEEYKYDQLNREVQLAKQTYTAYQERYQDAIVAAAAEIGSNNIVISSEAVVPERPTGPNKLLNMAVGIVLGGMLGIFVAFFRAYWKNS